MIEREQPLIEAAHIPQPRTPDARSELTRRRREAAWSRAPRVARWSVIAAAGLLASSVTANAAKEEPIVSFTPRQEKALSETYFNCEHEGQFGCLRLVCLKPSLGKQDAIEVQYLYRGVLQDFPEFLTPKLRACFVRAGGRFRKTH